MYIYIYIVFYQQNHLRQCTLKTRAIRRSTMSGTQRPIKSIGFFLLFLPNLG